MPRINQEYRHRHHIFQGALCFSHRLFKVAESLTALRTEIVGQRFAVIVLGTGVARDPDGSARALG